MASHTVENYLKAIYQAQQALGEGRLVPMGQLAAALHVVPGTATTMVKALAESGLVRYEPYTGVRLTDAGGKLAALVLRRHRLVELFLVQVMGMSWAEVHDEAEHLEHAVSDRLIDRIDEMLGRPAADPHGDPIPGPEGTVAPRRDDDLLSCPLRTPVRVSRVVDQDADFLRFIEQHNLKPGRVIEIESRDEAGDHVRVRNQDHLITLGMRAASKLLVQIALLLLAVFAAAGTSRAQTPGQGPVAPFEILDNSFLVEEAFNQEAGVFQNIVGLLRHDDAWELAFTQEWPVGSQAHQFSYTVPLQGVPSATGLGDILVTYRFQATMEAPGRPAFSPRLSLIAPSGDAARGLGRGAMGLQLNLPFSKQAGDLYWHWNAGVTWRPSVSTADRAVDGTEVALTSPHVAASAIWRVRRMFHLMMEGLLTLEHSVAGPGTTTRDAIVTLSPGVRGGWNLGDRQLVLGLAVPVLLGGGATKTCALAYLSYELPFGRR